MTSSPDDMPMAERYRSFWRGMQDDSDPGTWTVKLARQGAPDGRYRFKMIRFDSEEEARAYAAEHGGQVMVLRRALIPPVEPN